MSENKNFLYKIASRNDKKIAKNFNFDFAKKQIQSANPDTEVSSIQVNSYLENPENSDKLKISIGQLEEIEKLELIPEAKIKIGKNESAFLIIGLVLTSENITEDLSLINWFLTFNHFNQNFKNELSEISSKSMSDLDVLKKNFREYFSNIKILKKKSEEEAITSQKINYKSNVIKYEFKDGWRIVYVPAVGEMEEYPGLPDTSHDRILEGNKNGLCLGSSSQQHQNNNEGMIYSLRDPNNNPQATITIFNNELTECKSKFNKIPNVLACQHLEEWFQSLKEEGFEYEDNSDYSRFPPLTVQDVNFLINHSKEKERFRMYSDSWLPYWFGKGISKLDEDFKNRVENNDPAVILSTANRFDNLKEMAKPVALYWCKKYLDGPNEMVNFKLGESLMPRNSDHFLKHKFKNEYVLAAYILFGVEENEYGELIPLQHEIYKTYRKEPLFQKTVDKLAKYNLEHFEFLNLGSLKEYEISSLESKEELIRLFPIQFIKNKRKKPEDFDKYYDDLILAYKNAALYHPYEFIENYLHLDSIGKPFLITAVKSFFENNILGVFPREYIREINIPQEELGGKTINEFVEEKIKDKTLDHNIHNALMSRTYISKIKDDPTYGEELLRKLKNNLSPDNDIILVKNLFDISSVGYKSYDYEEEEDFRKPSVYKHSNEFIDKIMRIIVENNPKIFLNNFSIYRNIDKLKPYIEMAEKIILENEIKSNPLNYLKNNLNTNVVKNNILYISKLIIEVNPLAFIEDFAKESFAGIKRRELSGKSLLEIALQEYSLKDPLNFLIKYFNETSAKPYIFSAASKFVEENPEKFLEVFKYHRLGRERLADLDGKSFGDLAEEKLTIKKESMENYVSKYERLEKLSNILFFSGLKKEAFDVLNLINKIKNNNC